MYDLYCGMGTIGLALAGDALTVWGVEISEESVACALENADLNGIDERGLLRRQRRPGRCEELVERAGPPDVVVVDPPRAGLAGKALKRTGELGAPRLVYVSCNPTTLAGDAKSLRRGVRLRARPTPAGRHVPAHAARRDGRAARRGSDRSRTSRSTVGVRRAARLLGMDVAETSVGLSSSGTTTRSFGRSWTRTGSGSASPSVSCPRSASNVTVAFRGGRSRVSRTRRRPALEHGRVEVVELRLGPAVDAHGARPRRRSARQSRSAFGIRKPSADGGQRRQAGDVGRQP